MSVYFIRQGNSGPIKIGTAINPWNRIRELQTGNHEPLRVLAIIPGGRAEEAALHLRFAELRIERTEWFRAEARLTGFVEGMILAFQDQPTPPTVEPPLLFGLTPDQVEVMIGITEASEVLHRMQSAAMDLAVGRPVPDDDLELLRCELDTAAYEVSDPANATPRSLGFAARFPVKLIVYYQRNILRRAPEPAVSDAAAPAAGVAKSDDPEPGEIH